MYSKNEACRIIGDTLFRTRQGHDSWERLRLSAYVLGENLGATTTSQMLHGNHEIDIPIGMAIFDIQKAVISLRDEHLRTTGRRIWGLTFTLYPDGKYHIEYDYQKPADYEDDPADTIDGDEINQRLQQLQAAAPAMPPEQAYQQIGYCLLQALGEGWQQASIDIDYRPGRQVMMHFWQHDAHGRQQAPQVPPQASMVAAANAAYALLDNLLAQGGQAAQGLTLHLDAGGKMQLHYHYAS